MLTRELILTQPRGVRMLSTFASWFSYFIVTFSQSQVYNEELLRSGGLQKSDVENLKATTYVYAFAQMCGTIFWMYGHVSHFLLSLS